MPRLPVIHSTVWRVGLEFPLGAPCYVTRAAAPRGAFHSLRYTVQSGGAQRDQSKLVQAEKLVSGEGLERAWFVIYG